MVKNQSDLYCTLNEQSYYKNKDEENALSTSKSVSIR